MKRLTAALTVLAALTLFYAPPGLAQNGEELKALRKEVEGLKAGQTAIQKDLQEIKSLLQARPSPSPAQPPSVVLDTDGAPFKGDKHAKVTVIDFTDYQ